jgi:hypothetical protein
VSSSDPTQTLLNQAKASGIISDSPGSKHYVFQGRTKFYNPPNANLSYSYLYFQIDNPKILFSLQVNFGLNSTSIRNLTDKISRLFKFAGYSVKYLSQGSKQHLSLDHLPGYEKVDFSHIVRRLVLQGITSTYFNRDVEANLCLYHYHTDRVIGNTNFITLGPYTMDSEGDQHRERDLNWFKLLNKSLGIPFNQSKLELIKDKVYAELVGDYLNNPLHDYEVFITYVFGQPLRDF